MAGCRIYWYNSQSVTCLGSTGLGDLVQGTATRNLRQLIPFNTKSPHHRFGAGVDLSAARCVFFRFRCHAYGLNIHELLPEVARIRLAHKGAKVQRGLKSSLSD